MKNIHKIVMATLFFSGIINAQEVEPRPLASDMIKKDKLSSKQYVQEYAQLLQDKIEQLRTEYDLEQAVDYREPFGQREKLSTKLNYLKKAKNELEKSNNLSGYIDWLEQDYNSLINMVIPEYIGATEQYDTEIRTNRTEIRTNRQELNSVLKFVEQ